jgi:protein-disulfide isomerase
MRAPDYRARFIPAFIGDEASPYCSKLHADVAKA